MSDPVLAYIDSKIAAQKKASYVGGLSVKSDHAYAAQVLGALRGDIASGLHLKTDEAREAGKTISELVAGQRDRDA